MLESHGHEVMRYTVHNDSIKKANPLATAARTLWNRQSYRELRNLIRDRMPQVMHCTNTFPLISPAAVLCRPGRGRRGRAILAKLSAHVPEFLFLRNNRVCEDCLGKRFAWPAIVHNCYWQGPRCDRGRGGDAQRASALGTWRRAVDRYFTTTEFARQRFIAGGFPADRIAVKPNFWIPIRKRARGAADTRFRRPSLDGEGNRHALVRVEPISGPNPAEDHRRRAVARASAGGSGPQLQHPVAGPSAAG